MAIARCLLQKRISAKSSRTLEKRLSCLLNKILSDSLQKKCIFKLLLSEIQINLHLTLIQPVDIYTHLSHLRCDSITSDEFGMKSFQQPK